MDKMIKIKFIKDTEKFKIGEIANASKKSAESVVSQGYAEYIKEGKNLEKQSVKTKEEKIYANLSSLNIQQIKKDYPEVNIDEIIEKKVKLYRVKPFESRTKEIWIEKIKNWIQIVNTDFPEKEDEPKKIDKKPFKDVHGEQIFSRRGQIEAFWNIQPFFYDKSQIFWLWNDDEKKWELSDEVDFLNLIQESLGIETIDGKARGELVAGFKQVGRKHKPEDMGKNWVQYLDTIYDLKTGESFKATPKYFITNPIPWKIGESEDTPTIDKLFREWVEEKYVKTLYQLTAYNTTPDKFMQRIIGLCGGGSNGKGTFIKLQYKFLGEDNCVSTELKSLSEDRFETAVLYRKLLAVMGEVSHNDLKNTNQIKKIAGEDKMSFQFKGKTPFTDDITTTGMCLTNSMPITPDKSLGFYRKWMLVDFPNQFKVIKKRIIESIPDKEFENLAKKSLRILKELYDNPVFENEGDFQEREKRYEERSNPVMKFVEERCEEAAGENILLRDFVNSCNEYLKEKHLRILNAIQIGKILRNEGFVVGNRTINDISSVVILNLSLISKEKLLELLELSKSEFEPYKETNGNLDSLDSSNSFTKEKLDQAAPEFREMLEEMK